MQDRVKELFDRIDQIEKTLSEIQTDVREILRDRSPKTSDVNSLQKLWGFYDPM
jgi:signal transduction histidine kinase